MDPPVLIGDPLPQLKIVFGEDVNLTVIATGDNLMYQWQKDGVDITAGANSATYHISRARWSDEGEYRCVVSNAAGMATSNATNVIGRCLGYKVQLSVLN